MPKGGDMGGRRPRSPVTTLRKVEALATSIKARPGQLTMWSEGDLQAVVTALSAAGFAFQNELDNRAHRRGLQED